MLELREWPMTILFKRPESFLQELLNQSAVIHTKSWCNIEERLTQLRVPADYLVLESQRGTQFPSPHWALKLEHASSGPLFHSLFHSWLLIPKARLWWELNQPWPRSCSANPNATEINVLQPPRRSSTPHSVFLSHIPPTTSIFPSQGC